MEEKWVPINFTGHRLEKNFEGVPLEISYSGKIKRGAFKINRNSMKVVRGGKEFIRRAYVQRWEEKILATRIDIGGYETVNLRDKDHKSWGLKVHVLMAISWEVEGYLNWRENPEEYSVDHWDQNRQNNIIENLRFATKSQQKHNSGIQRNNATGYRGVSKDWRYALDVYVYRWALEVSRVGLTEEDLLELADDTGGILARNGTRIRYANQINGGIKHYETPEEAAIARDIKVIELEEAGIFEVGDTPLNFPELRSQIGLERWPVGV